MQSEEGRPREGGGTPGKRGFGKPEEGNLRRRDDQRGQRLDVAEEEEPDDPWVWQGGSWALGALTRAVGGGRRGLCRVRSRGRAQSTNLAQREVKKYLFV